MSRSRLAPLLLLVLIACGQESAGIGETASAVLDPLVQQVRSSATSGDRAGAASALAEVRGAVDELRQQGDLSEAGATRVLAAAAEVETGLSSLTAPTVPTTQVAPTTPPDTGRPTGPTRPTKPPKDNDNGADD